MTSKRERRFWHLLWAGWGLALFAIVGIVLASTANWVLTFLGI